ncbi:MAG TPA: tetratricopeptide repeat protein [Candidatus Hydrogenedentes bacterium]|nr:tetratricopeptide repeat protein [Candidatus Hydrogenedentota bacterium]HIJ73218.1 tetratricopeptide repeat protein [Candidatus Hydrogenedentota bacterium]
MRIATAVLTIFLIGCTSLLEPGLSAEELVVKPTPPAPRAQAYAHYMAARIYGQAGQSEKAIEELRKAWDLAPDSETVEESFIWAYARENDTDGIVRVFRQAAEADPDNVDKWKVLGKNCFRLERFEEAAEAYREATRIEPENPVFWVLLGQCYRKLERPDATAQAFSEALLLAPDKINERDLVSIERNWRDLVGLADFYDRLAELKPDSALVHFRAGLTRVRMNDTDGAKALLLRALELDPTHYHVRYQLGLVYFNTGEDVQAAEQFERYLERAATDERVDREEVEVKEVLAAVKETLAAAYARAGDYAKATRLLEEIVNEGPAQAHHRIELAYLLLLTERYDDVPAALRADEAPVFGAFLRALALKRQGKAYRDALDALQQAEQDFNTECERCLDTLLYLYGEGQAGTVLLDAVSELQDEGAHVKILSFIRGFTLMRMERFEEATRAFHEILDAFGPDGSAHYWLAYCYEAMDRERDTIKHLKACLAIDADDPDVLNFLGYYYADKNTNLDEAEELIKKALEFEPDSGPYLDSLGWVYYRKGDADMAIEFIRKAILNMRDDDAILRDHLGDAYLLKDDIEKALEQWRRARRLDPELEGVQKKIDRYAPKVDKK